MADSLQLLVYLLIATGVGVIAESLVGIQVPFGLLGATGVALIGEWFMTRLLGLIIVPELSLAGVPLVSAILGATIIVYVWSLLLGMFDQFAGVRIGQRTRRR